MSTAPPGAGEDIAALAKGGRTNFFGFLIRLAARLPFLFIAGRLYGPEALGAFMGVGAYACYKLTTLLPERAVEWKEVIS